MKKILLVFVFISILIINTVLGQYVDTLITNNNVSWTSYYNILLEDGISTSDSNYYTEELGISKEGS